MARYSSGSINFDFLIDAQDTCRIPSVQNEVVAWSGHLKTYHWLVQQICSGHLPHPLSHCMLNYQLPFPSIYQNLSLLLFRYACFQPFMHAFDLYNI